MWYDNFEQGFGFHIDLMRIRIQHFFRLRIRILFRIQMLMTKNWENLQWKKLYFFDKKLQYYLSLGLLFTPKPQKKPSSLKREHPALRNIKCFTFYYFCRWFLPSWILIQQLKLKRIWIRNLDFECSYDITSTGTCGAENRVHPGHLGTKFFRHNS